MLAKNTSASSFLNRELWQTVQPWIVCLCAALFFFYEFIQMNIFNPISTQLMRDFQINSVELGYLSSSYQLADVFFLLPAGLLLDRFSTRTIILLAMALCSLSTFGFALSHSVWLAGIFHFISGIGNGFCFISNVILVSRWFPAKQQALVMGLVVTVGMLGGAVAQSFTLLAQEQGWRYAMLMNGCFGLGLLLLMALIIRDRPRTLNAAMQASTEPMEMNKLIPQLTQAVRNSQNWLSGLYTCLMNLPIMLFGALWGSMYLTQIHHLTDTQASIVISMIFWGTIIGSPLAGWFSDNLGVRRLPMFLGALISLGTMLVLMYFPHLSMRALLVLFFALGFFTSAQIISYPLITESNPRSLTGTATSLAAILIMGGGGFAQPLFAQLMNYSWDGTMAGGQMVYSTQDFFHGLYLMPAGFSLSLILVGFIKETYCQRQK